VAYGAGPEIRLGIVPREFDSHILRDVARWELSADSAPLIRPVAVRHG
jgi:hypothetical protein